MIFKPPNAFIKKACIVGIACSLFCITDINQPAYAGGNWLEDPLSTQSTIMPGHGMSCSEVVPHKKPLTLADVVNHALCNNPQTREGWANVLNQAAKLGSSRAAYLPSIDGLVDLSRSSGSRSSNSNTGRTNALQSVSLNYLLFDFGSRSAQVEISKQGLIAADYTHNAILQNVLFAAVQAYYNLYSAKAVADATAENVKSNKASLDAASLRHKVGVAAIADKLQAETSYSQAMLKNEQARNQIRINQGVLANVMGIDPNYEFTITNTKPKELNANFSSDITSLLNQAKKIRPDIIASQANLAGSQANLKLQKSSGLPNITTSASIGRSDALSGGNSDSGSSAIGVTLNIPFFTGFDRKYQINAARQQLKATDAANAKIKNDALLDVWKTYNNFMTAKHTLEMTNALLKSAKKSEQAGLGRYKAGVGSITDLLSVQSQLADARQQYAQSQYGWLIAKADLLRSLGGLDVK